MEKQIFIHIGDAKTGSSSIQNYLTKNRDELYQAGILYSKTGLLADHGIANHKLAFCLNSARLDYHGFSEYLYQELSEEIKITDCQSVIISSEGFCSLRSLEEINKLRDYLNDYNVKIIVYLRRPDLWVESWYSQIVKQQPFLTKSFQEYLVNHQEPSLRTVLNYSKIFGNENIIVRPFELNKMYKNNLIDDFIHSIGYDNIGTKVDDINKSPDIYTTELLRVLNDTVVLNSNKRIELNEWIVEHIKLSNKKNYFSIEKRQEFLNKYKEEISEINEIFGKDNPLFQISEVENHESEFNPSISDIAIKSTEFVEFIKDFISEKK